MRFRKAIKICKGVKLNLSKSGVSATVGGKGLSLNFGPKGTFLNTSIPGTGLYDRKRIGGGTKKNKKSAKEVALPAYSLAVQPDGSVAVLDKKNKEITDENTLRAIRKTEEYKAEYAEKMGAFAGEIDAETIAFVEIYKASAEVKPGESGGFTEAEPTLESIRLRLEQSGEAMPEGGLWSVYQEEHDAWLRRRDSSAGSEAEVEDAIADWLEELELPVEFDLQYEYYAGDALLMLDIDLPEIEDVPDEKSSELASGAVKVKQKTQKELKQDYARCVFGLSIFFASHCFALAPSMREICASGYTQRRDSKSGELRDCYLYSIRFQRDGFVGQDWQKVEPYDFCMNFKNRCNLGANGDLKEIEPYPLGE